MPMAQSAVSTMTWAVASIRSRIFSSGSPVQHLPDHVGKLAQSDAAGHALAAGLGLAQVQEIQRHIHRAQARRAGGDPPFHVPVQLLHHSLCLTRHLDF